MDRGASPSFPRTGIRPTDNDGRAFVNALYDVSLVLVFAVHAAPSWTMDHGNPHARRPSPALQREASPANHCRMRPHPDSLAAHCNANPIR